MSERTCVTCECPVEELGAGVVRCIGCGQTYNTGPYPTGGYELHEILPPTFVINDRFAVSAASDDHGSWEVRDTQTGRVLSRCVRTVGELAEIVGLR